MAHDSNAASHAKTLPADLGAPAFVDGWKMRALIIGVVFSVIAVILWRFSASRRTPITWAGITFSARGRWAP